MNKLLYEIWRKRILKDYQNYLENPDDWTRRYLFESAKGCAEDMDQTFIRANGSAIYIPFWLFRQ